jgi:hypothetical protein
MSSEVMKGQCDKANDSNNLFAFSAPNYFASNFLKFGNSV